MNHHITLLKKHPKKLFAGRYTVSIMLEHRGKLLLVQEAVGKIRGKWSEPAGHIEMGETPFEAAIREAREEAGYKIRITGLFRLYFRPALKKEQGYINYTFLARPIGKQLNKLDPEIMGTKWYSKKELKTFPRELARSEYVLERINDWLSGHKSVPLTYVREIAYK